MQSPRMFVFTSGLFLPLKLEADDIKNRIIFFIIAAFICTYIYFALRGVKQNLPVICVNLSLFGCADLTF